MAIDIPLPVVQWVVIAVAIDVPLPVEQWVEIGPSSTGRSQPPYPMDCASVEASVLQARGQMMDAQSVVLKLEPQWVEPKLKVLHDEDLPSRSRGS